MSEERNASERSEAPSSPRRRASPAPAAGAPRRPRRRRRPGHRPPMPPGAMPPGRAAPARWGYRRHRRRARVRGPPGRPGQRRSRSSVPRSGLRARARRDLRPRGLCHRSRPAPGSRARDSRPGPGHDQVTAIERSADARLARLHLRGGLLPLARAALEQMAGAGTLDRDGHGRPRRGSLAQRRPRGCRRGCPRPPGLRWRRAPGALSSWPRTTCSSGRSDDARPLRRVRALRGSAARSTSSSPSSRGAPSGLRRTPAWMAHGCGAPGQLGPAGRRQRGGRADAADLARPSPSGSRASEAPHPAALQDPVPLGRGGVAAPAGPAVDDRRGHERTPGGRGARERRTLARGGDIAGAARRLAVLLRLDPGARACHPVDRPIVPWPCPAPAGRRPAGRPPRARRCLPHPRSRERGGGGLSTSPPGPVAGASQRRSPRERTHPHPHQARWRPAPAGRSHHRTLRAARPAHRRPQAGAGRPRARGASTTPSTPTSPSSRAWSSSSPPRRWWPWPSRASTRSPCAVPSTAPPGRTRRRPAPSAATSRSRPGMNLVHASDSAGERRRRAGALVRPSPSCSTTGVPWTPGSWRPDRRGPETAG